jgi:hypothetical protein
MLPHGSYAWAWVLCVGMAPHGCYWHASSMGMVARASYCHARISLHSYPLCAHLSICMRYLSLFTAIPHLPLSACPHPSRTISLISLARAHLSRTNLSCTNLSRTKSLACAHLSHIQSLSVVRAPFRRSPLLESQMKSSPRLPRERPTGPSNSAPRPTPSRLPSILFLFVLSVRDWNKVKNHDSETYKRAEKGIWRRLEGCFSSNAFPLMLFL